MDVVAEADALVEGGHGFARTVDVNVLLTLYVAVLMVYCRLDHSITDRLRGMYTDYEFKRESQ